MPEIDESAMIRAAERQVDRLTRAVTWFKYCLILVGVVCAGLAVLAVLFGIQSSQTRALSKKIQQGSITSCQGGNATRAADTQIWDKFVALLLGTSSNASKDQWNGFLSYVAVNDPAQAPAWDEFMKLYLTVSPATQAEAKQFEKYVAQIDGSRDCMKLYGK
jgi:hypothetical protein